LNVSTGEITPGTHGSKPAHFATTYLPFLKPLLRPRSVGARDRGRQFIDKAITPCAHHPVSQSKGYQRKLHHKNLDEEADEGRDENPEGDECHAPHVDHQPSQLMYLANKFLSDQDLGFEEGDKSSRHPFKEKPNDHDQEKHGGGTPKHDTSKTIHNGEHPRGGDKPADPDR